MLHAWVLFVAVAALLATGHGLLLRAIAPRVVSGVLVLPAGLAALVAVGQLPTGIAPLAPAVTPLVAVLGLVGLALGARRRLGRPELPAALALGCAFAVLAAPVVLSGEATFPGYTLQGDTTVHLMGASALPEHGRDVSDLPPSTYRDKLDTYFGMTAYPSGGPVALGALTRLVDLDPAWAIAPFVVLLAASIALSAIALLRALGAGRWSSALGGALAAQPALFYGYVQTSQIKEVGAAACIVLTAALAARWAEDRPSVREAIPVAVSCAAAIAFVGMVASAWLGLVLLAAVATAVERRGLRPVLLPSLLVAAGVAVLSFQTLAGLTTYVNVAGSVLSNAEDLGNLLKPLNSWQVMGVWLQGEWRLDPEGATQLYRTGVGIGVVVVAVGLGLLGAMRDGRWLAPALAVAVAGATLVLTSRGSAYADAKVLAISSPFAVAAAALGVAALAQARRRMESVVLGTALATAVLLSNAHAYHDANLAPRDRLAELERIGERLAGTGPTFVPDWDETAHHFLRDAESEGPNEPYAPRRPRVDERRTDLLAGAIPPAEAGNPGRSADLDAFGEGYIGLFQHLVVRRGPGQSRPSASFRRTYAGRSYEVWTAVPERRRALLAHLPVGVPVGKPRCGLVRRLARAADTLVVATRRPAVRVEAVPGPRSNNWAPSGDGTPALRVREAGDIARRFSIADGGEHEVWVEGSFGRRVDVAVDGEHVGAVGHHLNFPGVELPAGRVRLRRGAHVLELSSGRATLRPGDGGYVRRLATTWVVPAEEPTIERVPPARWRSLCDRDDIDWVEAYD